MVDESRPDQKLAREVSGRCRCRRCLCVLKPARSTFLAPSQASMSEGRDQLRRPRDDKGHCTGLSAAAVFDEQGASLLQFTASVAPVAGRPGNFRYACIYFEHACAHMIDSVLPAKTRKELRIDND